MAWVALHGRGSERLTPDEFARLLAHTENASMRGLFALIHCGLTPQQAARLTWGDVRWDGQVPVALVVRDGDGDEAHLRFGTPLAVVISRRARLRGYLDPQEPVFPGLFYRPYTARHIERELVEAGLAAGIPREKLRPGVLRRSLA